MAADPAAARAAVARDLRCLHRSDIDSQALLMRVVRRLKWRWPFPSVDGWAFWHLNVAWNDYVVVEDHQVLMVPRFSELRGCPHPCPKA